MPSAGRSEGLDFFCGLLPSSHAAYSVVHGVVFSLLATVHDLAAECARPGLFSPKARAPKTPLKTPPARDPRRRIAELLRDSDDSDDVLFEVLSFSRPRHLFSWAAYPYVIAQQRRFARDATAVRRAARRHRRGWNSKSHRFLPSCGTAPRLKIKSTRRRVLRALRRMQVSRWTYMLSLIHI